MKAIVIPARNEEQTIALVVREIRVLMERLELESRTIVVDDHSDDDTKVRAIAASAQVVTNQGNGLADAFTTGVNFALKHEPDAIIQIDADGQYMPSDIENLLEIYNRGSDLVIGDRLWRKPPGMTHSRYRLNLTSSRILSSLLDEPIPDAQSGLRVFGASLARACRISGRFTYTQEQIIRAKRAGFKISYTPIEFNARCHKPSRLARSAGLYIWKVMPDLRRVLLENEDH